MNQDPLLAVLEHDLNHAQERLEHYNEIGNNAAFFRMHTKVENLKKQIKEREKQLNETRTKY